MELVDKAHIFDIQGMSVHDGPGCRTVVFMQGCSLRCKWCSNPEGLSIHPQILYRTDKCRLDGNCVADCKYGALKIEDHSLIINRKICFNCKDYSCVENCFTQALQISSKEYSIDDLMRRVQRDRQFWGKDGGITISGGEPLLQIGFVSEFLKLCYDKYIHTAIETCGNIPLENYKKAIPYLDFIFFDLKHPLNAKHKGITGSENTLILSNLKWLVEHFGGRLVVRIPLMDELNNTVEVLKEYTEVFNSYGIKEVNILPLHHLGREKYELCGLDYEFAEVRTPDRENLEFVSNYFEQSGIKCYISGNTPF